MEHEQLTQLAGFCQRLVRADRPRVAQRMRAAARHYHTVGLPSRVHMHEPGSEQVEAHGAERTYARAAA
jgi:hypothetical protein